MAERSLATRISVGGPRDVSIGLDLVAVTNGLQLAIDKGTARDVRDVLRNLAVLHQLAARDPRNPLIVKVNRASPKCNRNT
ncbi:MAG TPA: hypothetical protein VGO62_07985, partial [Myxococcota bacterium]